VTDPWRKTARGERKALKISWGDNGKGRKLDGGMGTLKIREKTKPPVRKNKNGKKDTVKGTGGRNLLVGSKPGGYLPGYHKHLMGILQKKGGKKGFLMKEKG